MPDPPPAEPTGKRLTEWSLLQTAAGPEVSSAGVMRPVSRLECARSQAPSSRADVRGLPRRIAPAGRDRVELGEQTMPPPLSRMADHNPTVLVARAREHVA